MMQEDESVVMMEATKEEAQEAVELLRCFDNLVRNPDFDKLIHNHYFINEPARITQLLAHPMSAAPEEQTRLHNMLLGISLFRQFMMATRAQGEQAVKLIEDADNELDLIHQEELNKAQSA